jgi:hypothetical protein
MICHPYPGLGDASFTDAGLFALIDELRNCEKRRDDLLANLSSGHSDQVRAVAEKACDAARAIYEQIAARSRQQWPGCSDSLSWQLKAGSAHR